MIDATPATPVRQQLRQLLDNADEVALATNFEQLAAALRCPDWCILRHGASGDFTVHRGDSLRVDGSDGSVAVWLAQEDGKPATIAVQGDAYLTAGEAQALVGAILSRVTIAIGGEH